IPLTRRQNQPLSAIFGRYQDILAAATLNRRPHRSPGTCHLFPDLVVGEALEGADHSGMVPACAAVGCTGIEELLTGRRVRKTDLEGACAGKREIEVLLMQLDAKAWLERPLDHSFAVDLEYS